MASNVIETRDGDVIIRVRSSFVQEADRFTVQRHELALETDIANLGDIILAVCPVVLEEKCDGCGGVPMGAVQRKLENIGTSHGLGDLDGLSRGKLGRS